MSKSIFPWNRWGRRGSCNPGGIPKPGWLKRCMQCAGVGLGLVASIPGWAMTHGHTTQGHAWVSGGVSVEERQTLMRDTGLYTLWVVTAEQNTGAYLASVRLRVMDEAQQVVLDTSLDGPWFMVNLPKGRYQLEATLPALPAMPCCAAQPEQVIKKVSTIHAGDHHQLVFYFPVQNHRNIRRHHREGMPPHVPALMQGQ
jgi:hypothetical protein